MITYKSAEDLEIMREGGRILARTLRLLSESIEPGKTTTGDLDQLGFELLEKAGAAPSFLGYRNFPNSLCISTNEEVVHGLPGPRVLKNGDIVGLDLGVFYQGWHVDSAWTYPVGEVDESTRRLLNVTRESLFQGIAKARAGNRIGDIANTIQRYVEGNKYHIVQELVGHGIGRTVHEEPSVPNYGRAGHGPLLKEGMTICIEPMVNMGTRKIRELKDGWTVVAADGKYSAHFEHTVAITASGPLILTQE